MNSFRLTVLDVFSYMIPGLSYLLLYPYAIGKAGCDDLFPTLTLLTAYSIAAYAVIACSIGFVSDALAAVVVPKATDVLLGDLKKRVVAKFNVENPTARIETYHFACIYSFADVHVPTAREKADQMSAMSRLARNLGLSCLCYAVILNLHWLLLTPPVYCTDILRHALAALSLAALLILRADRFRRWEHNHLLNAYAGGRNNTSKEPPSGDAG